jgi:hypothetical protein
MVFRFTTEIFLFSNYLHFRNVYVRARVTGDRCYDFLNIFAEKIRHKMAFLTRNKGELCKILIVTLFFCEKRHFLPEIGKNRRKL